MPNILAYAVLLMWPLVMIGLFKKLTPDRALIWSFLGAFMLLPTGAYIDLPAIPSLDKFSIPSLVGLLLCVTMLKQRIRLLPSSTLASILMIFFVFSPFATLISNRAPIIFGEVFIPGMSMRDAISTSIGNAITLIPFILAFNLLSTHAARINFLSAHLIGALIYSIPMLLEVRLSPQLSYWIYGFYGSGEEGFGQQMRFGGFRPMVFMGHGLLTAFFTLIALLSTAVLWRVSSSKTRTLYAIAVVYLLIILALCKTIGVMVLAALFLPIILFASRKMQSWAIMVCTVFVLSYPILRSADYVPTDTIVSFAALVHEDRAQSIQFRFDNETVLLDHAAERALFGWGSWGRNLVYDAMTGRPITITDGEWIIVIGMMGWAGYISVFGLLTLPLLRLWWRRRQPASDEQAVIYGTSLLLAVNLLELLPNSSITTMTWLLTGLLLACSLQNSHAANEAPVAESGNDVRHSRPKYTRHAPEQRPYSRPSQKQVERVRPGTERLRR